MTETPEDIANLYSRARIESTRYWDFSASRKQVRQQLRLGVVRAPLEWPSAALPVAEFPSEPKDLPPRVQLQEVNIEDPGPQPQPAPQVETTEIEPQAASEPESGPQ